MQQPRIQSQDAPGGCENEGEKRPLFIFTACLAAKTAPYGFPVVKEEVLGLESPSLFLF